MWPMDLLFIFGHSFDQFLGRNKTVQDMFIFYKMAAHPSLRGKLTILIENWPYGHAYRVSAYNQQYHTGWVIVP